MANETQLKTQSPAPLYGRQNNIGASEAAGVALRDTRCGKCQRLLFRGTLRGEIKCPRCGHLNRWP